MAKKNVAKRSSAVFKNKCLIDAADNFRRAGGRVRIQKQLAAQSRLHAGHQQRGGNSLPADIGERNSKTRGAKRKKIVIVSADSARGFAICAELNACQHSPSRRGPLRWRN